MTAPERTPTKDSEADPLSGTFRPFQGDDHRPLRLLMDATDRCNLRCVMCHFSYDHVAKAKSIQWPVDAIGILESDILPFVKEAMLSSGTEPLMWKGFPAFLDALVRAGVPTIEMITNGLLMTEELANRIAAARVQVHFSMETAVPEDYEAIRVGADFQRFRHAIQLVTAARERMDDPGPGPVFRVTVMRRNLARLDEVAHLAHELGVDRILLQPLRALPSLGMEDELPVRSKTETQEATARLHRLCERLGIRLGTDPIAFGADTPSDPVPDQAIPDPSGPPADSATPERVPTAPSSDPVATWDVQPRDPTPQAAAPVRAQGVREPTPGGSEWKAPACDAPWTQFNIRPDGSVTPCCFWGHREPPLGDLREQSPREIWEGDRFRELRRQMLTGDLGPNCSVCPVAGDIDDETIYTVV